MLLTLGRGAFSNVYKCHDHKRNREVVIKILRDEERFFKQANKCEIPALIKISKVDSSFVIKALRIFDFRNHVCLSFEILKNNLYEELHKNGFTGIEYEKTFHYCKQILLGLDVLHKEKIIHCDLKPENIMITDEGNVKIIDLGSCYIYTGKQISNSYVQSRYYRAPEVVLGCYYNFGIDIWSFGCIVYELLTGKPMFNGKSESDLIGKNINIIGMPPCDFLLECKYDNNYFIKTPEIDLLKKTDKRGRYYKSVLLEDLYKTDINYAHIYEKIINWDYKNRPSARSLIDILLIIVINCHLGPASNFYSFLTRLRLRLCLCL